MKPARLDDTPRMVFCARSGEIFVHPSWKALGFDGTQFILPKKDEWVVFPKGSSFFYLPGHRAYGLDPAASAITALPFFGSEPVAAASCFLIPGYTRLYLPASRKIDQEIILPLWPYTAVGYLRGKFYAAAVRIDDGRKQRPSHYEDRRLIVRRAGIFLKRFSSNRLIAYLAHCALHYNCRNAQNLFLGRWEAPLPVSPTCNSRCLGCISARRTDDASSHSRIRFVPSPEEVAEIGVYHLKNARCPIVSFGQGCEGEPLLQIAVLKESIRLMRRQTKKGTIHLNTNGFDRSRIADLASCGLDSVRISLNSLSARKYHAYYRPAGYGFSDVIASIRQAKARGLFVSLNYLTFPGSSDSAVDVERLIRFLKKGYVDCLQMRNLSIDPAVYLDVMGESARNPVGILEMIRRIRASLPGLRLGYFNPSKEEFH